MDLSRKERDIERDVLRAEWEGSKNWIDLWDPPSASYLSSWVQLSGPNKKKKKKNNRSEEL